MATMAVGRDKYAHHLTYLNILVISYIWYSHDHVWMGSLENVPAICLPLSLLMLHRSSLECQLAHGPMASRDVTTAEGEIILRNLGWKE